MLLLSACMPVFRQMWVLTLLGLAAAGSSPALAAQPASPAVINPTPRVTLAELIELARRQHPALAASRARIAAAEAGVLTAQAWPNPELELQLGRQNAEMAGTSSGRSSAVALLQPLERPGLRRSRKEAALAGVDLSRAGSGSFERDFLAELQLRYHEVLYLQTAARLAEEDLGIAEQIRSRVAVRVGTGEAPRFELMRAETERLNSQRAVQAAAVRVEQARADLRRFVGPGLPADYLLVDAFEEALREPPYLESLREGMLARHPELLQARAELRAAQARLALERERASAAFAVRLGTDRVPESRDLRLGLVMSLPVFDRREGPIAEAQIEVERSRLNLSDRELILNQKLETAWQRYLSAQGQLVAFDSGILREARDSLRVAEAAYRFGERGILDYLDAQRTLRSIRNELNATRFELQAARIELERLRAESE